MVFRAELEELCAKRCWHWKNCVSSAPGTVGANQLHHTWIRLLVTKCQGKIQKLVAVLVLLPDPLTFLFYLGIFLVVNWFVRFFSVPLRYPQVFFGF